MSSDHMHLRVAIALTGDVIDLEPIPAHLTVFELKGLIAKKVKWPVHKQKLILETIVLDDNMQVHKINDEKIMVVYDETSTTCWVEAIDNFALNSLIWFFFKAPAHLLRDPEILEALRRHPAHGGLLEDCSVDLRQNRDFLIRLVGAHGWTLYFADEINRADRNIVLAALKNDRIALLAVSDELQTDPEVRALVDSFV